MSGDMLESAGSARPRRGCECEYQQGGEYLHEECERCMDVWVGTGSWEPGPGPGKEGAGVGQSLVERAYQSTKGDRRE